MVVHKVASKSDDKAVCGAANRGVPSVTVKWDKTSCKNCLRRKE